MSFFMQASASVLQRLSRMVDLRTSKCFIPLKQNVMNSFYMERQKIQNSQHNTEGERQRDYATSRLTIKLS